MTKKEWRDWESRDVWHIPSVRTNDDHEAKFPLELPWRFIQLLTEPGEIILDCFMGSGTTAIAAIQQQRRFIGIELIEAYVKLAQKNIKKAKAAQLQLLGKLITNAPNIYFIQIMRSDRPYLWTLKPKN